MRQKNALSTIKLWVARRYQSRFESRVRIEKRYKNPTNQFTNIYDDQRLLKAEILPNEQPKSVKVVLLSEASELGSV